MSKKCTQCYKVYSRTICLFVHVHWIHLLNMVKTGVFSDFFFIEIHGNTHKTKNFY